MIKSYNLLLLIVLITQSVLCSDLEQNESTERSQEQKIEEKQDAVPSWVGVGAGAALFLLGKYLYFSFFPSDQPPAIPEETPQQKMIGYVQIGEVKAVQEGLNEHNFTQQDYEGFLEICCSRLMCSDDNVAIASLLLQKLQKPIAEAAAHDMVFSLACNSRSQAMMDLLRKNDININAKDHPFKGVSPLQRAAKAGWRYNAVEFLLYNGSDLYTASDNPRRFILETFEYGSPLKALIKQSTDTYCMNIIRSIGKRQNLITQQTNLLPQGVLQMIHEYESGYIVDDSVIRHVINMIDNKEITGDYKEELPVIVKMRNASNHTILHSLVGSRHFDDLATEAPRITTIKFLLENKACPLTQNDQKQSALDWARCYGDKTMHGLLQKAIQKE